MTHLVDVILPASATPGALDVNVPQFIDKLYGNIFSTAEQQYFSAGATAFANRFKQVFQQPASDGTRDQFAQLLGGYFNLSTQGQDRIFEQQNNDLAEIDPEERDVYLIYKFLLAVRQNTLRGYFNSEKVGKEVLNYDPVPGRYDGCVPLADIGNAWTL
ncbi:MAG: gluconate 2-dehydrogenase subunit 3 family protein [Gammaproteobacteria bacterium]|nr:gluconate 2-dehydrogenase subunit 3 family protein [Gammaproteobacteria bacterium]